MLQPTEFELTQLIHLYDPVKAHKYYEEHKHLHGRKKGSAQRQTGGRTKKPQANSHAVQKAELQARIQNLEKKLKDLEALIRKKSHEEASTNRKSKAKKERAAKDKDKPKTAAEKAKIARESKQYRDKHKQELKAKAKKDGKSGGGSSKKTDTKKASVSDLKTLAVKVKGQIAVAKAKLAAL